jgi:uncharacterized membrane protein YphA (DoxX/SURF4 family)
MGGFAIAIDLASAGLMVLGESPQYEICVWFLAWIFAWSGTSKLRKPALAAWAMVDFGVVRHVRPVLGILLGILEIVLAFFLAVGIFSQITLVVVSGLLLVFTVLITRSLWRGDQFACFCFGESDSEMSKWTLARTAALFLLAALLAVSEPPIDHIGFTNTNVSMAVIALSVLGSIVLVVQVSHLLSEVE